MIAERYIMREIIKPAAVICFVLVFIYGSFIAARYWASAAEGHIPGSTVMVLVFFRVAVALEILLPTTLYLSVVLALSRMYRDGEITAMFACGISPFRITRAVFFTAFLAALLVACFSLFIRPWAWDQFYSMKARAKASFDLTRMKGGVFYEIWHGQRVIFAEKVNNKKNRAENIFIQTRRDDSLQIIHARQARQFYDSRTSMPVLILLRGKDYEFSSSRDKEIVLQFDQLELTLEPREVVKEEKVKATPTSRLLVAGNLQEIAELQWRLISPVSTLLLALLAVPLARSSPRQGKYARVPLAILVFAAYYNLSAIIKKWVAQGVISTFPGLWWSQLLLLLVMVFLFWQPELSLMWHRRHSK
jgi:lipopolysaccharide export system permease protein